MKNNIFNQLFFSANDVLGASRKQAEIKYSRSLTRAIYVYFTFLLSVWPINSKKKRECAAILEKRILKYLATAYLFGVNSAYKTLGFDPAFSVMPKFTFDQRTKTLLKKRAKYSISSFTRTNFMYLKKTDAPKTLIKKWRRKGSRNRALLSREFHWAFSRARFDVFLNSRIHRKRWICLHDSRTRESHLANERLGWIGITEKFINDEVAPGISNIDSFGCRCVLLPDIFDFNVANTWTGDIKD